ncbi:uncharacterized protein LOC120633562 [Pararge aegeria]|uniref:uncharacterized protein LOC120633562 n=1 Tax=Pararge aegeria TaxID=116150 RepID=UPI0019D18105|nr:uncharacterized protein LOC120633562 [Pararge aegeria]
MVRKYKKKGTRTQEVDEESMKLATDDVIQGRLSYRKAALKYNIKTSTLESRVKKFKDGSNTDRPPRTFHSKFTSLQVFSLEEETRLNDYIINCCKMHYGLTTVQIRKLAYEYAKALNLKYPTKWDENQMAGLEWMRKYRERNANLSLRKPENTSAARSFAFNKTAVPEFYSNLADVLQRHNFAADRIFNFDESGVSTVLETPKILAPKSQKQVGQIVSAERGELMTFGAIISASGNTIPPLFVFPRVHYKDHFLEGAPEGSLGAANRSGWINADIFVSVLKHIQKHTLSSKEHPILLLCDNHESHISLQAITYARDNGIIFVSFPPHTSHRLQPLDVGVFGPFKAKLKIAFNNWHMSNPGKTINIYNIPKLVKLAYFESFTAKNITSAFEKPGIWPFNEMAFSDEDFAPIEVYASNNSVNRTFNPDTSTVALELQPSTSVPSTEADIREQSPSLLQNSLFTGIGEPSTSAAETQPEPSAYIPITPEVIRPYPTAARTRKTDKGRKPGKSRIYTDTPEKNELEERHRLKELKKIEQERKARAKAVKRSLKELNSRQKKKKPKQIESDEDSEETEGSQFSLRESSTSPIDFETDEETDDRSINDNLNVTPEKIKDNCFLLVKFAKKTSVVYYIGKVLSHYSPTELKISYLRKKPGSWSFFFPDIEDIHTLYISDVAMILPPTTSGLYS